MVVRKAGQDIPTGCELVLKPVFSEEFDPSMHRDFERHMDRVESMIGAIPEAEFREPCEDIRVVTYTYASNVKTLLLQLRHTAYLIQQVTLQQLGPTEIGYARLDQTRRYNVDGSTGSSDVPDLLDYLDAQIGKLSGRTVRDEL